MTRLLAGLVIAAALPMAGCYVDTAPPPPAYVGPAYVHPAYGHYYTWRTYGRPPPPRY